MGRQVERLGVAGITAETQLFAPLAPREDSWGEGERVHEELDSGGLPLIFRQKPGIVTHSFRDSRRSQRSPAAIFWCLLFLLIAGIASVPAADSTQNVQDARGKLIELADYPEYVDRWAVIVGISRYADERLNLQFADRDADQLYELIRKPSGGGFAEDHILKLTNEQATSGEITKALRSFLKKPGKDDIVLLYFAAHGMPDPERPQNVYLITHDTDPDDISGTAVPMREVRASLQDNLLAERVVLLADTCHSAAVSSDIFRRGDSDRAGVVNRYLENVGKSRPGLAIMTSAEAGEVAVENERWGGGHGVFTHFLLEGIRGAADRQKEDGVVTIGELFDFVREQVEQTTEYKQHPSIGQTQYDRRLPMAITGGATADELYRLGLGLYTLGLERNDPPQVEYAADNFREASRLAQSAGARHAGAELELGRALLSLKRFPEALETLKGLADSEHESQLALDANLLAGLTQTLLDRDDEAEMRYRRFLARNPDDQRVPLVRRMVERAQTDRPARHALIIAVSEVRGQPELGKFPGTENDLERMQSVLEKRGFATESLFNPSRVQLTEGFRELSAKARPEDVVFIHFSGPGGPRFGSDGRKAAIMPSDGSDKLSESGISDEQLHEFLMQIPARYKTVILDTPVTENLISLVSSSQAYDLLTAQEPGALAYETTIDGQSSSFKVFTISCNISILLRFLEGVA